jgi:uncharacterized protein (TIGR02996 family)
MNEDEAFIRTIVDSPGNDTARLVYADWLDDRDDPRGAYVRAEHKWAKDRKSAAAKKLRTQAQALNAEWGARISRPPIGVCVEAPLFRRAKKLAAPGAIEKVERKYGITFPADYRAFLLNYNGGGFLYPPSEPDEEPDEDAYLDYFFGPLSDERGVPDLAKFAESLYGEPDDVNRGSELFPIGGPDSERGIYLLGVAGDYVGRVYQHEEPSDPWTDETYRWNAADSFAALLAELGTRWD